MVDRKSEITTGHKLVEASYSSNSHTHKESPKAVLDFQVVLLYFCR